MTPSRVITAIVAVGVVVLVALLATRPESNAVVVASPLEGHEAPAIKGTSTDGRRVDLAELRGRYVVVNFFATWCAPCRQEHPEIKKFVDSHPGAEDPVVVAVAYDENDVTNAKSFFAQHGGTWPLLTDDGSHVAIEYGVRGLPESFVIDPEGKVKTRFSGALTAQDLESQTRPS